MYKYTFNKQDLEKHGTVMFYSGLSIGVICTLCVLGLLLLIGLYY